MGFGHRPLALWGDTVATQVEYIKTDPQPPLGSDWLGLILGKRLTGAESNGFFHTSQLNIAQKHGFNMGYIWLIFRNNGWFIWVRMIQSRTIFTVFHNHSIPCLHVAPCSTTKGWRETGRLPVPQKQVIAGPLRWAWSRGQQWNSVRSETFLVRLGSLKHGRLPTWYINIYIYYCNRYIVNIVCIHWRLMWLMICVSIAMSCVFSCVQEILYSE